MENDIDSGLLDFQLKSLPVSFLFQLTITNDIETRSLGSVFHVQKHHIYVLEEKMDIDVPVYSVEMKPCNVGGYFLLILHMQMHTLGSTSILGVCSTVNTNVQHTLL